MFQGERAGKGREMNPILVMLGLLAAMAIVRWLLHDAARAKRSL